MISESALMNSAAEARFRLQEPNSKPRTTKVIALDVPSDDVVRRLAKDTWNHASFLTASALSNGPERRADGWLRDIDGNARDLIVEVSAADLVVMIATPGGRAQAAALIGEACSHKRVMTTALIAAGSASDEELSKTLAQLRPWSLMVVIASVDDYIQDLLTALRA